MNHEAHWLLHAAVVTAQIALFAAIPAFLVRARKPSAILLLLSTGALAALYFGELIPEVLSAGGWLAAAIIVIVWVAFSRLPGLHHHGSGHGHEGHDHEHTYPTLIVLSMATHCLASGALLYTASTVSAAAATSIFFALLAHKGYEALAVSTILRAQAETRRQYASLLLIYVVAFPLGVAFSALAAHLLDGRLDPAHVELAAACLGALAIGTLMSCMLHDFLLPSLKRVRERRREAGWLVLGAAISIALTFWVG